jgi:hypothetical protein
MRTIEVSASQVSIETNILKAIKAINCSKMPNEINLLKAAIGTSIGSVQLDRHILWTPISFPQFPESDAPKVQVYLKKGRPVSLGDKVFSQWPSCPVSSLCEPKPC